LTIGEKGEVTGDSQPAWRLETNIPAGSQLTKEKPTGFGEVFLNPIKTSFELPSIAIFFCYPAFWARSAWWRMRPDFD
jgi:hypothetical protein